MMKKVLFYFIVFAIANTIISCNSSGKQQTENKTEKNYLLKNAEWLIGEWKNVTSEGVATEIWTKQNDTTYFGKSYFVIGKDTVSTETINLEQIGKDLYYIPTVKDQNNGLPVHFSCKMISDKQLTFENLKHDYPTMISYTKINNDSLVAEISGTINGKESKQTFPMKREK